MLAVLFIMPETPTSFCSAFHGFAVRMQELPFKGPEVVLYPAQVDFQRHCGFTWSV